MDVVLVNGQQVTATATNQYSDLFRALKGGGSRFGVVTRFEVEPVRVGRRTDKNWYGGLILVSTLYYPWFQFHDLYSHVVTPLPRHTLFYLYIVPRVICRSAASGSS